MMPRVLAIDHVVLRVRNIEAALRFYGDVLGCSVERTAANGLVQLRAGRSLIDLVASDAEGAGRNMDHFALQLASFEEAALRAYLQARGVEVGETAVRYGADGDGPSLYVRDPDGNTVELKGPGCSGDLGLAPSGD